MTFRESSSLYDYSTTSGRIRLFFSRLSWRHIIVPICAILPFVLWIAVLQNGNYSEMSSTSVNSTPLPQSHLLQASGSSIRNKNEVPIENYKSLFEALKYEQGKLKASTKQQTKIPKDKNTKVVAKYSFVLTKGQLAPDNYLQPAYLINGQFPGPEIRVKQHSKLILHIRNELDVPITIHFHGIHQRGSYLSDGVPNVTQEPIAPGGSFIHETDTWPQAGTFFYHAHTAMDIVWIYGPLIIEDDPLVYKTWPESYQYDEDKVFILNGVYHENLDQLMERIAGPVHNYPAEVSSVTINGKSYGDWNNSTAKVHPLAGYDITGVKKGTRYRFRFINAASDSLLSCNISSHTFTVIEVDGIYVQPLKSDHLVLSPGQRYSIIIEMDQVEDNYFISCKHMESAGPRNGLAILNYKGAPKPSEELRRLPREGNETLELDRWLMEQLTPNYDLNQTDVYKVPKYCDKEFIIDVAEVVLGEQHVYKINGHLFEEPKVPYFVQVSSGINITDEPQVFEIIQGQSIQFVFQNQRTDNFCFSHPWHVHGHSFYVVGEGANKYDPVEDGNRIQQDILNGKRFMFRDSVTVYANQTTGDETDGAYCGWAAIRFWANNPGVWLAHCHVTPHMIMGKKFIMWEHPSQDPKLTLSMNN